MKLTGQQRQDLANALLDAFDRSGLDRVVGASLGTALGQISAARSLKLVISQLVEYAEQHSLVPRLLDEARRHNQSNPALVRVARQFGLAPETEAAETILRATVPSFDAESWHAGLGELQPKVCFLEAADGHGQRAFGTGIL